MIENLTDQEKKKINDVVFIILIVAIVITSIYAYTIYREIGFQKCVKIEKSLSNDVFIKCFNTSKELTDWIDIYVEDNSATNFIGNNYIKPNVSIDFVD
jgi:hypothetical protein